MWYVDPPSMCFFLFFLIGLLTSFVGRNELISDYIFRKTNKIRTRKQVSSHIQVLKNTRKGDSNCKLLPFIISSNDNN